MTALTKQCTRYKLKVCDQLARVIRRKERSTRGRKATADVVSRPVRGLSEILCHCVGVCIVGKWVKPATRSSRGVAYSRLRFSLPSALFFPAPLPPKANPLNFAAHRGADSTAWIRAQASCRITTQGTTEYDCVDERSIWPCIRLFSDVEINVKRRECGCNKVSIMM